MSVKTKNQIAFTVIKLLEKDKYSLITISEIAAHAGIVRKTFYNNFNSKTDVIEYIVENLVSSYLKNLEKKGSYENTAISRTYFEFVFQNKDVLLALIDNDLFHIYMDRLCSILADIYTLTKYENVVEIDEKYLKYFYSFNSYGINRLIYLWLKDGCKESVDELTMLYHQMTIF